MSSLLDRAKARHDRHLADAQVTLEIPGWGRDLAARYKVVDPGPVLDMLQASGARDADALQQVFETLAGFLALACTGMYVRDDQGRYEPLCDDHGQPVGLDHRLALALDQADLDTAGLVGYLFGGNKVALMSHAQKVSRWMEDTSQEVDGQVPGERLQTVTASPSPPSAATTGSVSGTPAPSTLLSAA